VITADVVEGWSQGEVARAYGVSQGWVSRLVARYRAEGQAAFGPRSRRPRSSPRAMSPAAVGLIIMLRKDLAGAGLDAGPDTIAWHLEHHHQIRVSPSHPGDRAADTHHRVRHDVVGTGGTVTWRYNGRLYHIGIGRTHARTHVLLLAADRHIHVINAATGEFLRDLELDPPATTSHRPAPPPTRKTR